MLSLSTSWGIGSLRSGREIIDAARDLDFEALELNYQFPEGFLKEIFDDHKRGELRITSLHNICPFTEALAPYADFFKRFNFSSPKKEIIKKAVKYTKGTIDLAAKLKASAVVLHLGEVELESDSQREMEREFRHSLKTNFGPEEHIRKTREKFIKLRQRDAPPFLERTIQNLGEVLKYAEEKGVKLGVENRYFFFEIPSFEEIPIILKQLPSPCLGYWHDCGHAAHLQNIGYFPGKNPLSQNRQRLIGIHLHDCIGVNDHLAPGYGEVDFVEVKKLLNEKVIKVLELGPWVSRQEVKKGIEYLSRIGID
jgi:sugar phosphate isomerase/epimerase